jgi:hypothetical protein
MENREGRVVHPIFKDESVPVEDLYYDDFTMFKVARAMVRAGLGDDEIQKVVTELQNAGILFRENAS